MAYMNFPLPILLVALFFAAFPWIPDPNQGAKAYLLVIVSLGWMLWRLREKEPIKIDSLHAIWFLWSVWWGVSSFQSKDWASGLLFTGIFISAGVFWVLAREYVRDQEDAPQVIMGAVLVIALLFAVGGLWQFVDYWHSGQRSRMLVGYLIPPTWGQRVSGPFGQPNFHALVMTVGLCSFAHFYFFHHQVQDNKWRLWGPLIISGLLWLNFFLTGSRGGQVGMASVLTLFIWHAYRTKSFQQIQKFRSKAGAFIFTSISAWALHTCMLYRVSLASTGSYDVLRSGNVSNRLNNWMASLLMFWDRPFFGIGPDNYKTHLYEYQVKARDFLRFEYEDMLYTKWTHNEYLQILAEGGTVSLLFMAAILIPVGLCLRRSLVSRENSETIFIFLATVPFLVQSLFSWPLRFTPFLATFLTLLAVAMPRNRELVFSRGAVKKVFLGFFLVGMISFSGGKLYWDMQVDALRRNLSDPVQITSNFTQFSTLAQNPFLEFTLLNKGIVPFVHYAVDNKDAALAHRLLPHQERAAYLEGVYWQWYNLARLQLVAGDEEAAKISIRRALDYNPIYGPGWTFLHYLDVLNAARATGRSVESFYPKGPVDLEIDHVGDTIPQRQKNL